MATPSDALAVGFGTLTTVLAFLISYQAYRAYKFTGRRYLINFIVSFLLLGISFYLVGLLLSSVGSQSQTGGLGWIRLVVQSVAFGLLASAYFSRSRRGEGVFLALFLAIAFVSIPILDLFTPSPSAPVEEYLLFFNFVLVLYVLTQAARGYIERQESASFLVSSGFGLIAFSQFAWFLWSADGGSVALLFALVFRLFGLAMLVQSFVELSKKAE